jgi:hypothetical protein
MTQKYYICPCCNAETLPSRVARTRSGYPKCPVCDEDLEKSNLHYRTVSCVIDTPETTAVSFENLASNAKIANNGISQKHEV